MAHSAASSWVAWHGIADDLSLAALALRDQVRLVDRTGATVASFPNPGGRDLLWLRGAVFAISGSKRPAT